MGKKRKRGISMSLMSILFRKGAAKSDKKRDAGLTTPSDIKRFDEVFN